MLNKRRPTESIFLVAAACFLLFAVVSALAAAAPPTGGAASPAVQAFELSPAVFVENRGQWDRAVRYGFDARGMHVSFTDAGPVFGMFGAAGDDGRAARAVFSAGFVGANPVRPVALDPSQARMGFYRGSDPSKWRSGVPTFAKVAYEGLYDGVDLYASGRRSGLKYEFHCAPGASWERIVVRYAGIEGLAVDDGGALHVKTPLGEIVDGAPVVYQETAAGCVEVAARFRIVGEDSYGFEITGAVDPSLPTVIDPDLAWSSYLGGNAMDSVRGVAVDPSGDCYVTGFTDSPDFPVPGAFDTTLGGDRDAFVARISAAGTLEWASYLGGAGLDAANGLALDASGDCYVTGYTYSANFPTPGGFDRGLGGGGDAFVARVGASGQLVWSSFLGGSVTESGNGIAVDSSGSCFVTGNTVSADFPTTGGFDTSLGGGADAFVVKVTVDGQFVWGSFLGGESADSGYGVAADASGDCYITGETRSASFPTTGGFDTSHGGGVDAFVAKVTGAGEFAWGSYIGGSDDDIGSGIAADRSGNCYVAGYTYSPDLPAPGGFQTASNGDAEGFLARVTPSGELSWATYFGGSGVDDALAVAVDALGDCYVAGATTSADLATPGGFDTEYNGGGDAFLAKVTASGLLAWSSFLGGSDNEGAFAVSVNAGGSCCIAGTTASTDFPAHGGFDADFGGDWDGFVAKVTPQIRWLEINRFQVSALGLEGTDAFVLKAVLNMPPGGSAPQTVTLAIDDWSVVMDAASWKQAGSSSNYTYRQGGVVAKLAYWMKGTSKCVLTVAASRQTLQGSIPHFPALPVRVQVGEDFDQNAHRRDEPQRPPRQGGIDRAAAALLRGKARRQPQPPPRDARPRVASRPAFPRRRFRPGGRRIDHEHRALPDIAARRDGCRLAHRRRPVRRADRRRQARLPLQWQDPHPCRDRNRPRHVAGGR